MNGIHDMGGMQNFGPVVHEHDEPRFHADWERRAFALTIAMGGTRMWNLDQSRAARESLPPAQYLGSSYYRIWIEALSKLMLQRGLVTREELADGRMRAPPVPTPGVLAAEGVAAALARGNSTQRSTSAPARFGVGDAVRTRVINIPTHTRLPRYCRGKRGTIVAVHGSHVFPDTNALGNGEQPQWLYTVRFDALELWGPDTTAGAVHVDCWEPYLEALTKSP
jgi:nitrile hydratase subunit beta